MKKNLFLSLLILLLLPALVHAQNYVLNGDFEQYTQCPTTSSQVDRCTGWRQYNNGTSDYFNSCSSPANLVGVPANTFGGQLAVSGNGYMGGLDYVGTPGFTDYKEYITAQIQPLTKGTKYEFSMSVSLAGISSFATDDLGVFFYDNGPTAPVAGFFLQATPQISFKSSGIITDTTNWVRVKSTFTADSAYDNIVIGGFDRYSIMNITSVVPQVPNPANYCYYYYDSVVLRVANNFILNYTDTFACTGDFIEVPYAVTNNEFFKPGNVFTLQMSDASGNFLNPIDIGSVTSTVSGTIKGYIPNTLPLGTGYKLRLISSDGADTTLPTINNINIVDIKALLTASITSPVCEGESFTVEVTSVPSLSEYIWTGPALNSVKGKKITVDKTKLSDSGRYIVVVAYAGCHTYDTVYLTVQPLPDVQITDNGPICQGDTLLLSATIGASGVVYTWTGPAGFKDSVADTKIAGASQSNKGIYTLTVHNEKCTKTISKDIDVFDPQPEIGTLDTVCENEVLLLNPGIPYTTYTWQDGITDTTYAVRTPGTYWVKATNKCGVFTDSMHVTNDGCDCKVFVPTAFTPNGDGLNDKIGPLLDCWVRDVYKFIIVNRYGEVVFKSTTPGDKWDGTYKSQRADLGSYYYLLQLRGSKQNKEFFFKGDITLVR